MSVQLKCRFEDVANGPCGVDIKLKEKSKLLKLHGKAKVLVSLNFSVPEEVEYVFNELRVEASKILSGRPIILKYRDDEGEMVIMESVPEFMECLKCVRRMDMLIRIIAIVQSGVMLTKKVKFMETPKQPKNTKVKRSAAAGSSDDAEEKEAPLPQWLLKLSEELKRQLKAELLVELRSELKMAPIDQTPAAPDISREERTCGICARSSVETFYVCLHPNCGNLTFCRSCEKHKQHDASHTLLKKPGLKSISKRGRKHRSKVDELIRKLEKKLDKRLSNGQSSAEKPVESEPEVLRPTSEKITTADVKLICENFVQEVVDMSNRNAEKQLAHFDINIKEVGTTGDLQSKETSSVSTTGTPNNTPCGTTPFQSHPQTPRSVSPSEMKHLSSAVENLSVESQQDKLISFSSEEEEDSEDEDDKFSCISCKSDSSLMSDEFELVPLDSNNSYGSLTDEENDNNIAALDSSNSSGRSSGFCVVDTNLDSPSTAVPDFTLPIPQLITPEETAEISSVRKAEVQLSRELVKESKEAKTEAILPMAVPSTAEMSVSTGKASSQATSEAMAVPEGMQFDLWKPPPLWAPVEQLTAVSEMPWSNANSWTKPRRYSDEYSTESNMMGRLFEMGFCNRELNLQIINKYQNKEKDEQLDAVVNELINLST